jgi:hypothetical protein
LTADEAEAVDAADDEANLLGPPSTDPLAPEAIATITEEPMHNLELDDDVLFHNERIACVTEPDRPSVDWPSEDRWDELFGDQPTSG